MNYFLNFTCCVFFITMGCAQENYPAIETPLAINYSFELVVDGIDIPWGMDFINESDLLVTELSGTLYRVSDGIKKVVSGLPEVYLRGQGGLLDVALHPEFKNNNLIYLTLASSLGDNPGGNTSLYQATLVGNNLEKVSLQISSLIRSEKENITQIVSNIKSLTSNLKESNDAINKILDNTAQLSDSLLASDIKGTINNAKQSLEEVNMILYDIKNGDGTLTRLINDSTIYLSVTQMIDEASRLVENIKTEPKRYVQFSIFGKTDKSILDSRDEKLLKKFAVDSLNF